MAAVTTYPSISAAGKAEGWQEPYQQEGVVTLGHMASGQPFAFMTKTFDQKLYRHILRHVSYADMESVRSFYETYKGSEFWWPNPSAISNSSYYHVQYEEFFAPEIDGDEDGNWMIVEVFRVMSNQTMDLGNYGYGSYGAGKYGGAGS